jgi:hypothetical protein
VNGFGPVKVKISDGNDTGLHLRAKRTKMNRIIFVHLSGAKGSQPEEPTEGKTWTQALQVSQEIVEAVCETVQIKQAFRERSASPEALSLVDRSIAKMRQNTPIERYHNSSTSSAGSPQSSSIVHKEGMRHTDRPKAFRRSEVNSTGYCKPI